MSAHKYLNERRESWTPIAESELEGLSDEHAMLVRQIERIGVAAEFAALSDIILNCTNKYQFAKTYKTLRADFQRAFAKKDAGNPQYPPEVNRIIRKIAIQTIERKLDAMVMWFWVNFDDQNTPAMEYRKAIEYYTNSGCPAAASAFLLVCAVAGAYVFGLFLFITNLIIK